MRKQYNRSTVYTYICQYKAAHDGASPTLREIMQACGISSTSVARYILDDLASNDLIRLPSGIAARGIMVTGGRWIAPPRPEGTRRGG
jgi:hypothetical protein